MYVCQFCESEYDESSDKNSKGFWCDFCDGFTYFDKTEPHKFLMILENGTGENSEKVVKTKLNKRLSPLRYPGGKSKLIDYLYHTFSQKKLKTFIEPFAGGASVGFSLLVGGIIEKLILNDLDKGVYSLYKTILEDPDYLISKINTEKPTHEDFFNYRGNSVNNFENMDQKESAWQFLVVNRLAYSGITKANPLGGKNGTKKDLLSRWNPDELIKRIKTIYKYKSQIEVYNMDALELIEEGYWNEEATIFIDPPYYLKGQDLYNKAYLAKDHDELCFLLDSLYMGCPGADIILTYDDHEYIEEIYKYPNIQKIGRFFSV